jgi:hypothetical protein
MPRGCCQNAHERAGAGVPGERGGSRPCAVEPRCKPLKRLGAPWLNVLRRPRRLHGARCSRAPARALRGRGARATAPAFLGGPTGLFLLVKRRGLLELCVAQVAEDQRRKGSSTTFLGPAMGHDAEHPWHLSPNVPGFPKRREVHRVFGPLNMSKNRLSRVEERVTPYGATHSPLVEPDKWISRHPALLKTSRLGHAQAVARLPASTNSPAQNAGIARRS